MLRRPPRIASVVLLLVVSWRPPAASAGTVSGTWASIVGSGSDWVYPGDQFRTFSTSDAWLTIRYDPALPLQGAIDFWTGPAGDEVLADGQFAEAASGGLVTFRATYGSGGWVTASFAGDPGDPASLTGAVVDVATSPRGFAMVFHGAQAPAVPEPSSLMTLGLGLTGMARAGAARRRRTRGQLGRDAAGR